MLLKQKWIFPCLIKHHPIKVYGGVEIQLQAFFISKLDVSACTVPRLDGFTCGEMAQAGWTPQTLRTDKSLYGAEPRFLECLGRTQFVVGTELSQPSFIKGEDKKYT
jgi:hypothetical protein